MRRLMAYLLAAVFGIVSGFGIASAYEIDQVCDSTMNDSFAMGQHVLVKYMDIDDADTLQRGDVVLFPNQMYMETGEGDVMMKRIIGMPGEWVSMEDGVVYIDGRPLDESDYLVQRGFGDDMSRRYVGANQYFVLGDHRTNSTDSRSETVGMVKEKDLLGKVIYQW